MLALLRSARFRAYLYQIVLAVVVSAILLAAFINTRNNLLAQGIATGFDFLERSTGWDISFAAIPYTINDSYARVFLVGFLNTLLVGTVSLIFATFLGTLIGMARVGQNPLLAFLGTTYVEIFRNVPLILQGLFWYAIVTHLPPPRQAFRLGDWLFLSNRGIYVPFLAVPGQALALAAALIVIAALALLALTQLPSVRQSAVHRRRGRWGILMVALCGILGVLGHYFDPAQGLLSYPRPQGLRFEGGLRLMPEFTALFIAVVLFGSAYIAEIVRGGLQSVSRGQLEAARALGLNPFQIYRLVRIPLALRTIVPPLGNQFVWLMKATTVGIAFGFSDLFMVSSNAINKSGQTIEILFIMMAVFLVINYAIASMMNALNRAIALKGYEVKRP